MRLQKKRVGCERRKILFFKLLFAIVGQKLFVVLGTFAADGGLKKPLLHSFCFSGIASFVLLLRDDGHLFTEHLLILPYV